MFPGFSKSNAYFPSLQALSFLALTLLYLHHALLFFVYIFNSPQMRKRLLPTGVLKVQRLSEHNFSSQIVGMLLPQDGSRVRFQLKVVPARPHHKSTLGNWKGNFVIGD